MSTSDYRLFQPFLAQLGNGKDPSPDEWHSIFSLIGENIPSAAQLGALLMALRLRGEALPELLAAAAYFRRQMIRLDGMEDALDCCGTGGDGLGTLNVSTAVAFVLAGLGLKVAKHGNRAASSRSGTADVLEALGIRLTQTPQRLQACLQATNFAFLMAPHHHPALAPLAPIRRELGFRTIFNLLGPLLNPAGVKRQLIGVFNADWLPLMAEACRQLGSNRVWVVHGSDGMDELAITGTSKVAELQDGRIRYFDITPDMANLPLHPLHALQGGNAAENAARLRALLAGESGAYRDIVVLNAAACLMLADYVDDLAEGAALAAACLDDGRARHCLDQVIEFSNHAA